MYLLGHNAHLTLIQSPAITADPGLGIIGVAPATRWAGDAQAYIDEDVTDEVNQGQRVSVVVTNLYVPMNIPVWPNQEDLLTITRIEGIFQSFSSAAPSSETLIVRTLDGGFVMLGKIMFKVVRS